MGKKFKKRFRGLCPCTKTSPTPEVEDGGNVGVKEKQPNPLIVTPKSQQLSKFDQMIVEIEAMYANLTEKLDHRHKSLDKFAKVIFGDKYLGNATIQGDTDADQSKPNKIVTQGEQENRYSDSVIQPNINIDSSEDKPKDHNHKVRETHKRSSYSDAILYQWMAKHVAASDDNQIKMMQPSNKTDEMKHIENDKAKQDEIEEVLYVIDRVFIVDPRISHDRKMAKISKADMSSINAFHNIDNSIGVKNTKRDWTCRMQIVSISNIAMVHKADTPRIIADTFISPHISAQPNTLDLLKVYGIVGERNQLSDYLPTSQRVEKTGNYYPSQIALVLSGLGESIQQLQNSRSKQRMHFSLDFGLLAATGFQAQILRNVIKILVGVSQFSPIDQQALVHGRRHAIQISTVFGQLVPIGLNALMFLISVTFGKIVPTGLRIQTTVKIRQGHFSLDLSYPVQTSLQVMKSGKESLELISFAFDYPKQTILWPQKTGKDPLRQTTLALDYPAKTCLRTKETGKDPLGQIALALDYSVETSLRAKKTGKDPLGQITSALDNPAKTSLRTKKPGKDPLGQIALALDYSVKTSLRAKKTGKDPLRQIALALDNPAKTSLRTKKTGKDPLGQIALALNYSVKTSLRAKKTGKDALRQIALALDNPAKASLRAKKTGKDPQGQIALALDYSVKTSLRAKKTGKDALRQIALALDNPAKASLRAKKTGKDPQGQIALALDYPVKASLRTKKTGKDPLGQIALALDYPLKIGLRVEKTGKESLRQISFALDYPAKTSLCVEKTGKDPLRQISFVLDYPLKTSLRIEKTGKDPLRQIALILDYSTKTSLRAKKSRQYPLGQISFALDYPVKTIQRLKNTGKDPLEQIALELNFPAKISLRAKKTGKDLLGQIALVRDNPVKIGLRIGKTTKDPLRQIALALDFLVKASLRTNKTGKDPLGQIALTFVDPFKTSLRTKKTRKDPQGQIALALDYPVKTSQRIEKTGKDPLRQIALVLDYSLKTSLRIEKTGKDPLRQITLVLDCPAKTSLRTKKTRQDPLGQISFALDHPVKTIQRLKNTGKYSMGQIALALDFPVKTSLQTKTTVEDPLGQIALALEHPVKISLRAKKTGEDPLGQITLALEYPFKTSLRVEKTGEDPPRQIALTPGFSARTSLRVEETEKDPLGNIALTLDLPARIGIRVEKTGKGPLGQIALALDYPVTISLRTKRTGNNHLEQILLAVGHLTLTNQQAKKTEYERFEQIFVAIGHFASLNQYDENNGTEHVGKVSLPFDKYPFNLHRVQNVRREQIKKMLLALETMATASFQNQKYEKGDHGKISAFGRQTLTSLPAKTTGNAFLGQIFVSFGNQVSTMQLERKQVFIGVDLSILSRRSVLKRPALNGHFHTPSISEYFPSLTNQSNLVLLKEETNKFSNSGSCIALGTLTSPRKFKGTKTAVTNSICFRSSHNKDDTETFEMKTAQLIRDMFGPSHKIAEVAGLGITKDPMTVGPTSDFDGSRSSIDQSDYIKVLERISTPEPKGDSVEVYCCFAKLTRTKKPKGKSTVGQIHGVFGICRIKNESAGLKDVVRRTSDKEDLNMLRQSRFIVQPNSYLEWKSTVELTPDRLGLCRTADLMARMDEHTEKTTDIDACSNKTPIISVRTVSVGSSTEDEVVADTPEKACVKDESKHNDCIEGNSEKSHIEGKFPEGNTDCVIPKTNIRTSHRNTQDKSTDTTDLPRPDSPAPVVPKGPVPGSTFGRCVLKQEVMGNLQDLMDKGVRLDESHAKFLCINLIDILKYLLTRGVIHTNICPRNIFFDEFGYPCLTGYDKCIYIGSDPHTRRKFRPSIEYCSPEQAMKTYVTEATDVFSVGVLCFNVVYGRPPHQGRTYKETRDNIVNNNFIPKFEPDGLLSKSGKFFLVNCIRKDLDKRFNVRKCGQSLVRSVKWFNDYDEKALLSHTMPSPFLQLLEN